MESQLGKCLDVEIAAPQVCKAIPKGKVATYGILAAATKSSPRAVGQVAAHLLCRLNGSNMRRTRQQLSNILLELLELLPCAVLVAEMHPFTQAIS